MGYSGPINDTTLTAVGPYFSSNVPRDTYGAGANHPVYFVSWEDIVNIFIPRLNAITGRTFRLPTEAEWEYAARGGKQSHDYLYSGGNDVGTVAWYSSNSSSTTHVVGGKAANELALHDMSGNVLEWCSDRFGDYTSSDVTNPQGPTTGSYRVLRGGSWSYNARFCRVAFRYNHSPDNRYNYVGFRLVLVP
jgi:formylglycine-generating enzyme required for sulfatase activity